MIDNVSDIATAIHQSSPRPIAIITGAKLVKARHLFNTSQKLTYLYHEGTPYKMNSAAGVVYVLAQRGYDVHVQAVDAQTKQLLVALGYVVDSQCVTTPLRDKEATDMFVSAVAKLQRQFGGTVSLVHYGSASEVAKALPEASLAVSVWDTPADELHALIDANVVSLYALVQSCRRAGVFDNQPRTKLVPISAIAARRPRVGFGLDNIQKAAGHALARTLALELASEDIHVTELLVGSLDGGYYDNDTTLRQSITSSAALGYAYGMETKPLFTAEHVGEAVAYALGAGCAVREIVVAPYGQYPHMGA